MEHFKKIIDRLKEPSSWAAIAIALGVFGIEASPEYLKVVTQAGTGVSALMAVLMSEKGGK